MARLGDVCNIQSGGTPLRSIPEYWNNGTIPWVKISDISGKCLNKTEESITELGLSNSSAKMLSKGTILYTIFATLGEVCILNIEATTNQAIAGIKNISDEIDNNYLYYYLLSTKKYVNSIGRGVAQNNINMSILRNFEFPIPHFEQQKKIAVILDKVNNLITLRKQQLEKLDILVKSRYIEMFGNPVTNPMGWVSETIRDVVREVKYGTSRPAVDDGKYPYLRMNNITYDGHLSLVDVKHINIPDNEFIKCVAQKGDVLFNRTNSKELVGKTCVYGLDTPMIIAGYIIRLRVNEKVLPIYLSAFLNSKHGKKTLFDMCKSIVGQANINAQELQNIKILVPSLPLQTKFTEFVEKVDRLSVHIRYDLDKLETLKRALMQQYFE